MMRYGRPVIVFYRACRQYLSQRRLLHKEESSPWYKLFYQRDRVDVCTYVQLGYSVAGSGAGAVIQYTHGGLVACYVNHSGFCIIAVDVELQRSRNVASEAVAIRTCESGAA